MSKYDKQIVISHEEEGSYHRREVNCPPETRSGGGGKTTYHTERYIVPASKSNKQLVKAIDTSDDDNDNYEEWTTSKRKVNHTTRQVETRVSRQLLVEDGKVIADSGPQVTTRIKEDNKVEECEKEKAPKNKKAFEALENAPEGDSLSGRVLGEKKEIQRVSREVREENMQYHDERFKELSGRDVHRRAIKAPHELMTIQDEHDRHSKSGSAPRGKMVHYSNKGKKYQDTDEILEVAKLAIDGSITKEVKRTRHHEEFSEDEKPDEKGEAEALRAKPIVERSSRRHVDYVNDFDDIDTPETSDNEGGHVSRHKSSNKLMSSRKRDKSDEAFPRYEIDPLLNSLRDEDFKRPTNTTGGRQHSPIVRQSYEHSSSDDEDTHRRHQYGQHSPQTHQSSGTGTGGPVEIPEEYRVNKQRLMSGRGSGGGSRSQSPRVTHSKVVTSSGGNRGNQKASSRREDASVQARLTDEEEASSELNAHSKTTRYLQRQSTPNSSKQYYYGEPTYTKTRGGTNISRRKSISSASSLSSSDIDEARERQQKTTRKNGVQSRDSGFRSPAQRAQTPASQIYSVSSKSKKQHPERQAMVSPTPSAGQRSVKTKITTMSAGLKDRPLSPEHLDDSDDCVPHRPHRKQTKQSSQQQQKRDGGNNKSNKLSNLCLEQTEAISNDGKLNEEQLDVSNYKSRQRRQSLDTISLSSLKGPNATTIKVPYKRIIEIEPSNAQSTIAARQQQKKGESRPMRASAEEHHASGSEMSLQEDIENLSKRLANIRRVEDVETQNGEKKHFDYKTIMANVQTAPQKHHQIIDTYNVQIIHQNQPFLNAQQVVKNTTNNNNNQSDSGIETTTSTASNNNESNLNLNDFHFKYRAIPALVEPNVLLSSNFYEETQDDDRMSSISNCSLHSSKTYNIRKAVEETINDTTVDQQVDDEEDDDSYQLRSKNPAWIFDPRDGSTTNIAPPPKPKKPPTPEVQTEELVQARGGRSYYLELVEKEADRAAEAKKRAEQEKEEQEKTDRSNALYSRWTSQGALNGHDQLCGFVNLSPTKPLPSKTKAQRSTPSKQNTVDARQINPTPSNMQRSKSTRQLSTAQSKICDDDDDGSMRQLSSSRLYHRPPASLLVRDKSKSSSCLMNSKTKPSKYSIYGGFRKPDETSKPVPRLSYSRAIGPRSQRHIDPQPKLPSRYLKMK